MLERILFGIFVCIVAILVDHQAFGATGDTGASLEVMCRAKAKDVAVRMYQGCVTEARNKRIDEIRKEYQAKLSGLKKYYDSELKKVGGRGAAAKAEKAAPSAALEQPSESSDEAVPVKSVRSSSAHKKAVEIPAAAATEEVPQPVIEGSDSNVETVNVQEN